MIYSLNGKLIYFDQNCIVVECAGVGYQCCVTYNTLKKLPEIGNDVFIYTYMSVREDAVVLFGFISKEELEMFKLLITVNSVGPKMAIAILSELSPEKIFLAVSSGDAKAITKAQGVGNKTAQRIVLELKDKISTASDISAQSDNYETASAGNDNVSQAVSALVSLGYSQSEASSAVSKTDITQPLETIIKNALKYLF